MAYWVDDNINIWPESIRAGTAALGLYLRCGAWLSRAIGGGLIAEAVVPAEVAAGYGTGEWARKLVAVGLWEHVEDGYRDCRYHAMGNPTAEKVAADRAAKKARQDRWLAKKRGQSPVETVSRWSRDASQDVPRDLSKDDAPSHPPTPSGWDGGVRPREARGAGAAPPTPAELAQHAAAVAAANAEAADTARRGAAAVRAALAAPERRPA